MDECYTYVVVESPRCIWLFVTLWTAAYQASLSLSLPKFYYYVTEASQERFHNMISNIWHILEKAKQWSTKINGYQRVQGRKGWISETTGDEEQWKYSVWYDNGGCMPLYTCHNPQDVPHKACILNYGFGVIMMYQQSTITALMMTVGPSTAASLTILLQEVQSETGRDYLCTGRGYMLTLCIQINFSLKVKLL